MLDQTETPIKSLNLLPELSLDEKFSGPVSGPMLEKLKGLDSKYPDTFNWSIYDDLYEKFGAEQPRGGVVFKTNFKLVNFHHDCSKCHYAFEIDTYGRGCTHNCIYCYAKDQLTLKGYWNRPHPMPVDLAEIRKIFYTVFETDKKSKWREVLESRIPLRIGSMSDSFMWMDRKFKVSLELLKILKFYQYPYIIFTRSDLIANDDYIEALDKNIGAVQFSISGNNEEMNKLIEPGAPSLKRRLKALKKLNESGIYSTVRLNPLFPTYPDGYFTDFDSVHKRFGNEIPRFDFFNIDKAPEFLAELKEAKVQSFLAGFVRLNQTSISQISKASGINFRYFFKPENYTSSGESHYSSPEVTYYYKMLSMLAKENGIRFSTCYIGNGIKDYYQHQDMWSNKKDCCDIVSRVSGFQKTAQDIPWETRLKHSLDKESGLKVQEFEERLDNDPELVNSLEDGKGISKLIQYKGKMKWEPKSESQV